MFSLLTIREIKEQYAFLTQYEGFDHFDDWMENDYFLVANNDVLIDGHFCLDVYEDEIKEELNKRFGLKDLDRNAKIEGILIEGNLFCNGSIINEIGDYGPFMHVSGNIICQSLLLGGAYVVLEGDVTAEEIVMTDYNHGYLLCKGAITSPVFIAADHYSNIARFNNSLFYYNDRLRDHPPENASYEDETTGDYFFSDKLLDCLDNPLTRTYEELKRDIAAGEYVLKGQTKTVRDAAYWEKKVRVNYCDLKRVPKEYKTRELCMSALQQTYFALQYFPDNYIDETFCLYLVENDGLALHVIPKQFITKELCYLAAEKGTFFKFIPEHLLSEDLIITAFTHGHYEPDINDVPARFISRSFLVQYVLLGKGLWLDKACKENGIDKNEVIRDVIETGINTLDTIFSNHCSIDAFNYAAELYNNAGYAQEWSSYMDKYRAKLKRIGIDV